VFALVIEKSTAGSGLLVLKFLSKMFSYKGSVAQY
jgi:hypothetical protein